MSNDTSLRREITNYLTKGGAHASLTEAARGFTAKTFNQRVPGLPYTAWGILEHIRRAQRDMLDFIRQRNYKAMKWPDDYWPAEGAKATAAQWRASLRACQSDLKALVAVVKDTRPGLEAPIEGGDGQTLVREVLQVIDHNAYHTGQLFLLKRLLAGGKRD